MPPARQRPLPFDADDELSDSTSPSVAPSQVVGPGPVTERAASMISEMTLPLDLSGKSVYVVDAFALMFQVFHALPEMTSPQGQPVGCIFGFLRDLLYLLDVRKPDHLFVAFDMPGKTFRHDLYAAYKEDRAEMPDSLRDQIPGVQRMIDALGVPRLGVPDYEADDVMATLARLVEQAGGSCILVTNDKDCRQLLSDRVRIFLIRKQMEYDTQSLAQEWGVRPEQVVDFQALIGDPVDHIPGVPLIGPKIAGQLLQQYETLEGIYAHLAEIPGAKRKQNLAEYRDTVLLSRRLVRLETEMPLTLDWEASRPGRIRNDELVSLCREYGFRTYSERFGRLSLATRDEVVNPSIAGREVSSRLELEALEETLLAEPTLALSVIASDPSTAWGKIRGFAFAWGDPIQSAWVPARLLSERDEVPARGLRRVFESSAVRKVGHDLKVACVLLRSAGVRLEALELDTMIAAYLLDAGSRNHGLAELSRRYLGEDLPERQSTGGREPESYDQGAPEITSALLRVEAVWKLIPILRRLLDEQGLTEVMFQLEMPLVPVLAAIESVGIRVDASRLAELERTYSHRLHDLEREIVELAEQSFNINAPKQLGRILFEKLK
ncbi:MAG TPA: 5'-3' exonuclease H3TH domain-containing protein, partial [Pirellulaceae bacterium]